MYTRHKPEPSSKYHINDVFYSLQGEGARAGEPAIFVRFAFCNMKCKMEPGELSPGGFDCDTEFMSSSYIYLDEISYRIMKIGASHCKFMILTGGEPGLQVDGEFISYFHSKGYELAIETNGSVVIPESIDWITVSPKVANHAIKQLTANEVKYVRNYGQAIPQNRISAPHKFISPAAVGNHIPKENIDWCVELVKYNPDWKLTTQMHKYWNIS